VKNINKNILLLGLVSLFTDISSEMIFPILPIFLDKFLNATKTEIGFIEGLAEAFASFLKVFSGIISDKLGRKKPLIIAGYGISSFSKPLLYFANSWVFVLFVRVSDRIGKGIRTAPRDALISTYSTEKVSGKSFGIHRAMDTTGAVLGTLLAFLFLFFLGETEKTFRFIFLFSIVPAGIALFILIFLVKEPKGVKRFENFRINLNLKLLPIDFYKFLFIQGIFTLIAMNYAFMILKAENIGISIGFIPVVYLVFNISYALFSYPLGNMSDKFGKIKVMFFVYILFSITSLVFTIHLQIFGWIGFILYGMFMAGNETVSRAFISDFSTQNLKGTAYGIFHFTTGITSFISLSLAGFIWDSFGANVPFYISSIVSVILACILLIVFRK
jgi:MFS family permease